MLDDKRLKKVWTHLRAAMSTGCQVGSNGSLPHRLSELWPPPMIMSYGFRLKTCEFGRFALRTEWWIGMPRIAIATTAFTPPNQIPDLRTVLAANASRRSACANSINRQKSKQSGS